MGMMCTIKEENRDQHQRSQPQQRENRRGMLELFVINPHADDHGGKAGDCPSHLAKQEEIT
jgi:hypothetical protein